MMLFLKIVLTALLVTVASIVSSRSNFWGGIITSLPINSILVLSWMYWETKDVEKVATMSHSILLMIFPMLIFFVALPFLLKKQVSYPLSLTASCMAAAGCYWLAACLYSRLGFKI